MPALHLNFENTQCSAGIFDRIVWHEPAFCTRLRRTRVVHDHAAWG